MVDLTLCTSYWFQGGIITDLPLTRDEVVDVAVVGGGYAGLSCALHLKNTSPHLRVALLEANHAGYGASGRNAGWLSAFPPLYWLADDLNNPNCRDDFQFATRFGNEAISALQTSFEAAKHPDSWRETQHYLLARNGFERAVVQWLAQRVALCGTPCATTHKAAQHPVANYPHVASMSWNTTMVDPYHIVRHLRELCSNAGVMIYENTPVQNIANTPQFLKLTTDQGITLKAEKVILATNAYTSHLTLQGKPPRASAHHTYMIATEPLDETLIAEIAKTRISFGDPSLSYYCARFHGNRLLFNGKDRASNATTEDDAQPQIYRALHQELVRRFPILRDTKVESAWGGPFMETRTETPIIRASAENPNLIYNIGYGGGSGIGAALQSGRLVTDLVLGNASTDDEAKRMRAIYAARRFPLLGPVRVITGVLGQMLHPVA